MFSYLNFLHLENFTCTCRCAVRSAQVKLMKLCFFKQLVRKVVITLNLRNVLILEFNFTKELYLQIYLFKNIFEYANKLPLILKTYIILFKISKFLKILLVLIYI